MMKHVVIAGALLVAPMIISAPASALPGLPLAMSEKSAADVIEVKGGRGHGWGRGHKHRAFGWSRGRKVGWRGYHCPPGQWKKGRC
jgi:hypothetical protein